MSCTSSLCAPDPLTHAGLAYTVARRYAAFGSLHGFEENDLKQIALLELCRLHQTGRLQAGIDKAAAKGLQPSTCITWMLRSKLHREINRQQVLRSGEQKSDEEHAAGLDLPDHRHRGKSGPEDRELVTKLLARLPKRERLAVAAYYGLDGQEEAGTLDEVAARIGGITGKRAWQLVASAIERMQRHAGIAVAEMADEEEAAGEMVNQRSE